MKRSIGTTTLVYPTPVFIVGTYDRNDKPNAMAVAWGGICSSEPPSVAISVRKVRYTYENLMDRKAFTISVPSEKYVRESDYFGIVSGKNEDKFENSCLEPVASRIVDAPYVGEFPLILECRVTHITDLGAHTQFVGEIKDVKVDEDCLDEEGVPDVSKILPFWYSPSDHSYYAIGMRLGEAYRAGSEFRQKRLKECSPTVGPGHDPEG
ncbi:MAG: flavin reductase family protein [Methanomassiliicoccales archaeon]